MDFSVSRKGSNEEAGEEARARASMILRSSTLYYAINLALSSTSNHKHSFLRMTSLSSVSPKSSAIVSERSFVCSDGVKLASRYWRNFDAGMHL